MDRRINNPKKQAQELADQARKAGAQPTKPVERDAKEGKPRRG